MLIRVYDMMNEDCLDEFNLSETDPVAALRRHVEGKNYGRPQGLRYKDRDLLDTESLGAAGLEDGAKVYRYDNNSLSWSISGGESSASGTTAGASRLVGSSRC